MRRRHEVTGIVVGLLMLNACGGGGGDGGSTPAPTSTTPTTTTPTTPTTTTPTTTPSTPVLTTFSGGTLDELKALNPALKFDRLAIVGRLKLPVGTTTTIEANGLLIGPQGAIEDSYGTCDYRPAPDLSLVVKNDAVIEGEVLLSGRSGTTTTSTATCNSCTGQSGGDLSIAADTIRISSRILNGGGGGASNRDAGLPSTPCSAGASGSLNLSASTVMDLSGIQLENRAGTNFENTAGTSNPARISAGGAFTLKSGKIDTSGALTFSAATTDIWGEIRYRTLADTIGGQPDTTPPAVAILSPTSATALTSGQSTNLMIQSSDVGLGVREAQINAFGRTSTVPVSQFSASMVTVPLTVRGAMTPATIEVTVTDNKGLSQKASLTGLRVSVPPETEPNNSFDQAQTYTLGGALDGTVRITDAGLTLTPPPTGLNPNVQNQHKVEDIYKVVCCDRLSGSSTAVGIEISLDYSSSASQRADLDMYLFSSDRTRIIASAIEDNVRLNRYTEKLIATLTAADQGKTFYLAIQANNTITGTNPTSYRLGP